MHPDCDRVHIHLAEIHQERYAYPLGRTIDQQQQMMLQNAHNYLHNVMPGKFFQIRDKFKYMH